MDKEISNQNKYANFDKYSSEELFKIYVRSSIIDYIVPIFTIIAQVLVRTEEELFTTDYSINLIVFLVINFVLHWLFILISRIYLEYFGARYLVLQPLNSMKIRKRILPTMNFVLFSIYNFVIIFSLFVLFLYANDSLGYGSTYYKLLEEVIYSDLVLFDKLSIILICVPLLLRSLKTINGDYLISDRLDLQQYILENIKELKTQKKDIIWIDMYFFKNYYVKAGRYSKYQLKEEKIDKIKDEINFLILAVKDEKFDELKEILLQWFEKQVKFLQEMDNDGFIDSFVLFEIGSILNELELTKIFENFEETRSNFANLRNRLKSSMDWIVLVITFGALLYSMFIQFFDFISTR